MRCVRLSNGRYRCLKNDQVALFLSATTTVATLQLVGIGVNAPAQAGRRCTNKTVRYERYMQTKPRLDIAYTKPVRSFDETYW